LVMRKQWRWGQWVILLLLLIKVAFRVPRTAKAVRILLLLCAASDHVADRHLAEVVHTARERAARAVARRRTAQVPRRTGRRRSLISAAACSRSGRTTGNGRQLRILCQGRRRRTRSVRPLIKGEISSWGRRQLRPDPSTAHGARGRGKQVRLTFAECTIGHSRARVRRTTGTGRAGARTRAWSTDAVGQWVRRGVVRGHIS